MDWYFGYFRLNIMKISISTLSHTFNNGTETKAIDNISCEIGDSQFVAIIGPSGCGKSTLLRLMANLVSPTSGSIRYDDLNPSSAIQNGKIAWMSQSPALLPWLTVQKNLDLSNRLIKNDREFSLTRDQVLSRVGLSQAADQYPFMLSGGMQQRLALARLLIQNAPVWLMDEPFAALDEITRERLSEELFDLWKDFHPTVLWVTHNIYEAIKLADRILVFSPQPGRLIADVDNPLAYPRQENTASFQNLLKSLRHGLKQTGQLINE
jgi:NitT/TauT family transport system ATP-binding protein